MKDLREIRAELIVCANKDSIIDNQRKESIALRKVIEEKDKSIINLERDVTQKTSKIILLEKAIEQEKRRKRNLGLSLGIPAGIGLAVLTTFLIIK
jgi:PIN domain nuclease of toxin-antitoxin system